MMFDAGRLEEVLSVPRVHGFYLILCPYQLSCFCTGHSACLYSTADIVFSFACLRLFFNFCSKLSELLHVGEVGTNGSYGCQTRHFLAEICIFIRFFLNLYENGRLKMNLHETNCSSFPREIFVYFEARLH